MAMQPSQACPCGERHRRNKADCQIAAKAEAWGASVAWANDPDHMQHLISFTPSELMSWLADNR